jgi:hypothetical protein
MPFVRGRVLAELDARLAKPVLDVLIWSEELSGQELAAFNELEQLQLYLDALQPQRCRIRLVIPSSFTSSVEQLNKLQIRCETFDMSQLGENISTGVEISPDVNDAVQVAQAIDADVIVVSRHSTLAYLEDVLKFHILLMDSSFLLICAERFVRGFEVPWSFRTEIWNQVWTTFYLMAEEETFREGLEIARLMHAKGLSSEVRETCRSLVYNRLTNICFTRDRLLWFEHQRRAARRSQSTRQSYFFEISYFLNFYYLLLYGLFDHLALVVNGLLDLRLAEKEVGAGYKRFLEKLRDRSPAVHDVFTNPKHVAFMAQIAFLRNYAAHRGSIAPTKVVQKPEREPTTEEIDAQIASSGLGWMLEQPDVPGRDVLLQMARSHARMQIFEKNTILEDVVWIEVGPQRGFLDPLLATTTNFANAMQLLKDTLDHCRLELGV